MAETYNSKTSLGDLRVNAIKIMAIQINTMVTKTDAYFITSVLYHEMQMAAEH